LDPEQQSTRSRSKRNVAPCDAWVPRAPTRRGLARVDLLRAPRIWGEQAQASKDGVLKSMQEGQGGDGASRVAHEVGGVTGGAQDERRDQGASENPRWNLALGSARIWLVRPASCADTGHFHAHHEKGSFTPPASIQPPPPLTLLSVGRRNANGCSLTPKGPAASPFPRPSVSCSCLRGSNVPRRGCFATTAVELVTPGHRIWKMALSNPRQPPTPSHLQTRLPPVSCCTSFAQVSGVGSTAT
jgi:hypothetical protein